MENIKKEFYVDLKNANDKNQMEDLRNKYFSKKGIVNGLLSKMKEVEDKKTYGEQVNELKKELFDSFNDKNDVFVLEELNEKLITSKIDVTIPTSDVKLGKVNILLQTKREIEMFFQNQGFEIAIGSEVESDYYNFESLNLDENHPARDMQDTFYLQDKLLLRTHTSNIQSRVLEKNINSQLKVICSGKVYRRDDDDATHSHQFMQMEGFCVVNKNSSATANLKDLKTILTMFVKEIFNNDKLQIRMRPSFFPFTEPSVEVDVTCSKCLGVGCSFCKQTGWIEILGAGIIDKSVLNHAGFDSTQFMGYAFGIGVERITLLKYNIDDIRNIYINDHRFIDQY